MSTIKNWILVLLISLISFKNTHSFSDYKHPFHYERNHKDRQQFSGINSSPKNEKYISLRLLRENKDFTSHGNLIGVNTMSVQTKNHRQNTLDFHWGKKSSGYVQLLKSKVSDVALDVRRVNLMKSIPMNMFMNVFLTLSLNAFITILI